MAVTIIHNLSTYMHFSILATSDDMFLFRLIAVLIVVLCFTPMLMRNERRLRRLKLIDTSQAPGPSDANFVKWRQALRSSTKLSNLGAFMLALMFLPGGLLWFLISLGCFIASDQAKKKSFRFKKFIDVPKGLKWIDTRKPKEGPFAP